MNEPHWADIVSAIATAVAAVAVIFVFVQVRLQRTQLHRELENLYVERYWHVMDRLEHAGSSRKRRAAIVAYLALSEDQLDLRKARRVTDATWDQWGPAIWGQVRDREFRRVLEGTPPGRFALLRAGLEDDSRCDPLDLSRRKRWWFGLR